jgi:hypothetical protein
LTDFEYKKYNVFWGIFVSFTVRAHGLLFKSSKPSFTGTYCWLVAAVVLAGCLLASTALPLSNSKNYDICQPLNTAAPNSVLQRWVVGYCLYSYCHHHHPRRPTHMPT